MSLSSFTTLHVVISLVAIVAGFGVMLGLRMGKSLESLTKLFLLTTAATSVTGFFFPFHSVTPAIIVGGLSLAVLLVAILARYPFHLAGAWRSTYVIAAAIALYLNVFVLVVQSFLKVPALHALAPKQNEPPFAVAQLAVLALVVVLGVRAVKGFRIAASS